MQHSGSSVRRRVLPQLGRSVKEDHGRSPLPDEDCLVNGQLNHWQLDTWPNENKTSSSGPERVPTLQGVSHLPNCVVILSAAKNLSITHRHRLHFPYDARD